MPNVDAVYRDRDEWGPQPWRRGASILHIEYVVCRCCKGFVNESG
jgi:phosphopantothenoylcysteine decarboxylase